MSAYRDEILQCLKAVQKKKKQQQKACWKGHKYQLVRPVN